MNKSPIITLPGKNTTLQLFYLSRLLLLLLVICDMACTASRPVVKQVRKKIEKSAVFSAHFTGFVLFDPVLNKTLYTHQADKYFTPASNTKIFTFYTSLNMLGDSIPALQYSVSNDSLIFRGTGDPTFLHPDLKNTRAYTFLSERPEKLFYNSSNFGDKAYGPGWAWDDFNDAYQPERGAFPVYGNIVRFQIDTLQQLHTYPQFFARFVQQPPSATLADKEVIRRDFHQNVFSYQPTSKAANLTLDVPYKYSAELTAYLLTDTLHKPVLLTAKPLIPGNIQTLYSIPADSVYKRMMQESDNFLAEQLLLLCASTLGDTLTADKTIGYAQQHLLQDLPDKPIWREGSGLSRYNLFTPRSITTVLSKIYKKVLQQRLFAIFPAGGQSGTIKKWYKSDTGQPYVYAKTGTLSNNHSLSGYLVTKRGKVLVFSFMHNNIVQPINNVRKEMQEVLKAVYEKY